MNICKVKWWIFIFNLDNPLPHTQYLSQYFNILENPNKDEHKKNKVNKNQSHLDLPGNPDYVVHIPALHGDLSI